MEIAEKIDIQLLRPVWPRFSCRSADKNAARQLSFNDPGMLACSPMIE